MDNVDNVDILWIRFILRCGLHPLLALLYCYPIRESEIPERESKPSAAVIRNFRIAVAPRAGARIETRINVSRETSLGSLPVRERGSKQVRFSQVLWREPEAALRALR